MNKTLKCCLLGDSGVGKTSMIASYTANTFPHHYTPTVLDTYNALVNVGNEVITLTLYDTSGKQHPEHSQLRQALMKTSDAILVCYSVTSPQSLLNIKSNWHVEIRAHAPSLPVVMVGTQLDRVNPYARASNTMVTEEQARDIFGALGFKKLLVCSALTQEGLKQVFDAVIRSCVRPKARNKELTQKKPKRCLIM